MNLKLTKQNKPILHILFLIEFIALGVFFSSQAKSQTQEEQVNRQCSAIVGIPYASDNFTDEEWNRFLLCKKTLLK